MSDTTNRREESPQSADLEMGGGDYEFQYLNHEGTWQSCPFEIDEEAARSHFQAMTTRYPRQKYRVIRRTVTEEVILQNGGGAAEGRERRPATATFGGWVDYIYTAPDEDGRYLVWLDDMITGANYENGQFWPDTGDEETITHWAEISPPDDHE